MRGNATVVTAAVVLAAVPLAVTVVVTHGRLDGWGLGFVLTGVWVLLLTLTVQAVRALRVRRRANRFPGGAGRRHDTAAVAAALVAIAPADWTGLRLEVDDDGRRVVVTHAGGRREPLHTASAALEAAVDQLESAVGRAHAPHRRLVLVTSRDGTARVTVE